MLGIYPTFPTVSVLIRESSQLRVQNSPDFRDQRRQFSERHFVSAVLVARTVRRSFLDNLSKIDGAASENFAPPSTGVDLGKPPFTWDEGRRLTLRARLDALYFHLYGVTETDDVKYIYSTFPIVEKEESAAFGSYRSRGLCLAHMNALAAGDPDAEISIVG